MDPEQEMYRLQGIEEDYNKLIHSHPTLRDQFAMAALQISPLIGHEALAKLAYQIADAMLTERSKK